MDTLKPLFTATATATGGRNGHTEASEAQSGPICLCLRRLGGPGKPGTTTPEHLFAAGYAACFGGALDFVAKQHKQDASKAKVTCAGFRSVRAMATAKEVKTDCSVNAAIKGKTYCFSNEQAKTEFMKNPDANLAKAVSVYGEKYG
jgi:organic hydroperoxide reductase OsmC/OhrA